MPTTSSSNEPPLTLNTRAQQITRLNSNNAGPNIPKSNADLGIQKCTNLPNDAHDDRNDSNKKGSSLVLENVADEHEPACGEYMPVFTELERKKLDEQLRIVKKLLSYSKRII